MEEIQNIHCNGVITKVTLARDPVPSNGTIVCVVFEVVKTRDGGKPGTGTEATVNLPLTGLLMDQLGV
ncbi:MAG TPA: hypothetical protein VIL90_12340, partial [Puia sp.]